MRFSKLGKIRFTSHRDVARMWERALRRAGLPVAYTEGFSPRPKLSFGLALPTSHESMAEYLDVNLVAGTQVEVDELPGRLSAELPGGIDVTAAAEIGPGTTSLQEDVRSCTWLIEVRDLDPSHAQCLIDAALAAPMLMLTRTRKAKQVTDDLRPAVRHLSLAGRSAAGVELQAELDVHPRSVRPAEMLLALSPGDDLEMGQVVRTAQWIWRDGAREEPLRVTSDADAAERTPVGAP